MKAPAIAFLLALAAGGCFSPTTPAARTPFEMGRDAAQARDYATAVSQLTLAIESNQSFFFTAAYLERGESALNLGKSLTDPAKRDQQYALALKDFDAVLAQPEPDPSNEARALSLKGSIQLSLKDPKGAEATFLRILPLELPPAEMNFKLDAYRQIGWIYLERARASWKSEPSAAEELGIQEEYRRAQDAFSSGLTIDPEDQECNLGKGICLHYRGQDREAISFLQKSIAQSEAHKTPNTSGHYYLGRALELQKGLQLAALDHYRTAVEQDSSHSYTPLYLHLVDVLEVYVKFEDPLFRWFLDSMLAYSGDTSEYWDRVETLAGDLVPKEGEATPSTEEALREKKTLAVFARALAKARSGKIDAAVQDALLIKDAPDFPKLLGRIFPGEASKPEYLYGKASALLGARKYKALDSFFQEEAFQSTKLRASDSPWVHKVLVLEGRNILARWLAENPDNTKLTTPENKMERDKTLGRARDSFQAYLERYPRDAAVRMDLGKVQELMESFAAAFLSFALVARESTSDATAFRAILPLHQNRLLPQKDMTEAWTLLRSFSGTDLAISDYVRRTQSSIQAETLRYCQGCGRKAADGETTCLECGRHLGTSPGTSPPEEK